MFDAFIKIDGVPGECTDAGHADWIEVLSYNHSVNQQNSGSVSSGGGRSAGRCDHAPFSIVKTLDKATPKLNLFCCSGEHIPTITIDFCRSGKDKQLYMQYKLYDVLIGGVSVGGSSQGESSLPLEEVTFNYAKIEWTYTETDHKTGQPKGNVAAGWDQHSNQMA